MISDYTCTQCNMCTTVCLCAIVHVFEWASAFCWQKHWQRNGSSSSSRSGRDDNDNDENGGGNPPILFVYAHITLAKNIQLIFFHRDIDAGLHNDVPTPYHIRYGFSRYSRYYVHTIIVVYYYSMTSFYVLIRNGEFTLFVVDFFSCKSSNN